MDKNLMYIFEALKKIEDVKYGKKIPREIILSELPNEQLTMLGVYTLLQYQFQENNLMVNKIKEEMEGRIFDGN